MGVDVEEAGAHTGDPQDVVSLAELDAVLGDRGGELDLADAASGELGDGLEGRDPQLDGLGVGDLDGP